jgi:hypothetical protein
VYPVGQILFVSPGPRRSDSGGASFLGEVWEAVRDWRASGDWAVPGVRRFEAHSFEAQLAAGTAHRLPPLALPGTPPAVPAGASPAEVRNPEIVLCFILGLGFGEMMATTPAPEPNP